MYATDTQLVQYEGRILHLQRSAGSVRQSEEWTLWRSIGHCSNYMQARVCRAPSLLVRAPILSEIFGVQRGPA